ncbi:uncharacterized protein JN550_007236 [Neoarthrinium moseri]|uniref:uncharacterized protein n=1 Tax=Neoarthrinium moseri TaxID=1658444 RepID=UPI001FDD33D0|nr:uncharacterized protein JN550_007236 [Neoarthrinium moseri]KAI1867184.1 hypothetical protein JN550_007236 [Neoarthrinium moseri]
MEQARRTRSPSSLFVDDSCDVEPDDDAISLTSTVRSYHPKDEEFVVDDILAERQNPEEPDHTQYLIQWEGYPLFRASWEPVTNLSDELLQQWLEQKEEGGRTPFDVQEWEDVRQHWAAGKASRHNRRNRKRLQLGLQTTDPFPATPDHYLYPDDDGESEETHDSSDEAMEVDEIEQGGAMPMPTERKIKQTMFTGVPPTKTVLQQGSSAPSTRPEAHGNPAKTGVKTSDKCSERPPVSERKSSASNPSGLNRSTGMPSNGQAKSVSTSSSSSLANKFRGKKLKATRTANPQPLIQRTVATGPASALHIRRRRTGLKEAMMDQTKAPKLMSNMRRVNLLAKKARELNDAAPANPAAIPSHYIITGDAPRKNQSIPDALAEPDMQSEAGVNSPHAMEVPSAIAPLTGPKKSRGGKSVRFTEGTVHESTASNGPASPGLQSNVASKRGSLSSYQRTASQTVARFTSFGPEGSQEVDVEFNGIPRGHSDWLVQFLSEEHIQFCMLCSAADFFSGDTIYEPQFKLASGSLSSPTEGGQAALDAVAVNLLRTSAALYLPRSTHSILVFPTRSPAWSNLVDPAGMAGTLDHLIFRPNKPLDIAHYPALSNAVVARGADSASLRRTVMKQMAELDYDTLLSNGKKHVFFLMYHGPETFLFQILVIWLRACQPDCQIFRSVEQGGWNRYQEATLDGVVILHESVERSIRKIPRLWDTLKHGGHIFWSLSSPDHESTLITDNDHSMPDMPPQLKLTRLFPHGRAFLLTPSFMISQPAKLCELLEFIQLRSAVAPCVLVVCSTSTDYLLEIALEKARRRDLLTDKLGHTVSDQVAELEGLSQDEFQDRLRAWELMKNIMDPTRHGFKSHEDPPEDIGKVVLVDDLIAPDDEQSLVNWFAAWSLSRLDCYRKFYVVGSSLQGIEKARKMVRVPNYVDGTVNDPDVHSRQVALDNERGQHSFRSHMFRGDSAADFAPWFNSFNDLKGHSSFWMYFLAVCFLNREMADHLGDFRADFGTFKTWFHSAPKFTPSLNSLVGLFYTVETDWTETDQTIPAARHPWIAVFRPVNPHLNKTSYADMELLIWDFAGRNRWPASPSPEHLLPMQRRLVDYVREAAPARFENYALKRVFVSSWTDVDADPSCPVDVTCRTLEAIVHDRAKYVPPWEQPLIKRGWKLLGEGPAAPRDRLYRTDSDMNEPERLIFHPARGEVDYGSACINDLYEAVVRAREKDPNCTTLDYKYMTTVHWYQDLKDEKRAYKHINVDSWDRVFEDLNLQKRRP